MAKAIAQSHVTRRELAALLSVHMQTVTTWERSGMPVLEPGRKGKPSLYSPVDVKAWLKARDEAAKKSGVADLAHERARRERAQAVMAEQLVAMRARDLVPRQEVEKAWAAEVAAVRSLILGWPTTAADKLFRAATLHGLRGVENVLRSLVEELLLELADPERAEGKRSKVSSKRKR